MKEEKIKRGDIVVGIHGSKAEIGEVVGTDEVHRLGSNGLKPKKYAYHVCYSGASEGFYKDARKLKKLNTWQADRIKEILTF